jgi:hypothetical protein
MPHLIKEKLDGKARIRDLNHGNLAGAVLPSVPLPTPEKLQCLFYVFSIRATGIRIRRSNRHAGAMNLKGTTSTAPTLETERITVDLYGKRGTLLKLHFLKLRFNVINEAGMFAISRFAWPKFLQTLYLFFQMVVG